MSREDCDAVRPLLSAHLEGDLDQADAVRVQEHLKTCPACREQLETLRLTVAAFRRLPEVPAPASILANVRERLHPVPWHRRVLTRRPWLAGVPVGALATVLVVIGIALFQARYPELPRVAERPPSGQPSAPAENRQPAPRAPTPSEPQRPAEGAGTATVTPTPAIKPPAKPAFERAARPAPEPLREARPGIQPPEQVRDLPPASRDVQPPTLRERRVVGVPSEPSVGARVSGPEPAFPPPQSTFPTAPPPAPARVAAPAPARAPAPAPALTPAPMPMAPRSSTPAPIAVPRPEARAQWAPRTPEEGRLPRTARLPETSPPPTRLVTPEHAAPTVPRSQSGQLRSIVGAITPGVAGDKAASLPERTPSPGEVTSHPGTGVKRITPAPGAAGQRAAGAIRPSAEALPRPTAPAARAQEPIEALTVLLAPGEEVDEIRQIAHRAGGRTVETRVLDPRARSQAFEALRSRAGVRNDVSRGWELTVRMPMAAIGGFADALERRPGRLVLQRNAALPSSRDRAADLATLRITVLR